MKGQINYEYIAALLIFITFIFYFFFQLLSYRQPYMTAMRNEFLRSEGYQISEMLINDAGQPANWETLGSLAQIYRLGLSNETLNRTGFISQEKITKFENYCQTNGYSTIKQLLGSKNDFSVYLKDLSTGSVVISCYPTQIQQRYTNITMRRIVAFDSGDYGELTVQMW
jgi:hypothetical protein